MTIEYLTERQLEILKYLRDKAKEGDRQLLEHAIGGTLPMRDIEAVCLIINRQFLMNGIRDDYNPNEYGNELENLLDTINRPRITNRT
jgi:hypothetical protein